MLNTSRGTLRAELPPAVVAELERSLEPLAERLAEKLADVVEGPGFEVAVEKYVTLERWVEDGLAHPELERAVREFVAGQRARLLRDERPLLERLPPGLVAALEQAIADYLPVAVERLGDLLTDPAARARVRDALKRFLDRAIRSLLVHERLMAKLRSEEHTSELQSQSNLVCRLLLEKKKSTRSGRPAMGWRLSSWRSGTVPTSSCAIS